MVEKRNKIPKHVAIIMDGNRRWAAEKGKNPFLGHKKVVAEVLEELIEEAGKLGIEYITFWAWSTENWSRGKEEVGGVMKLFRFALARKAKQMIERGARLRVIGDIAKFPEDIRQGIEVMMESSKDNKAIKVTFGLNYGGKDELLRAINKLLNETKTTENKVKKIKEEDVERHLDTAGMPDPDLIIRTGGTKRLSGFMLWQAEYSELYFTEVLMPEFGVEELRKAVGEFGRRERRFGGGEFGEYKK